jgi:hypothetical protein
LQNISLKMATDKLFSDKWLRIIGILLIGIAFPLIFGLRPGHPKFIDWTLISVGTTFLSWVVTRQFGIIIWNRFPWEKNPLIHILIVLVFILFFTIAIIGLVFVINLFIYGKASNYWETQKNLHIAIFIVFVFAVIIHEAVFLFFLWKKALTRAADLEKENIRSKFEALKNHVNPHFLFNSLGTLASLINTDQKKATQYVNEFSKIYRYFLEVNSNDLVTIEEEMDFINSYIFLQQIRHGEGFSFDCRIDKKYYKSYILPLTLQLLIENALKHNTTIPQTPLYIEVYIDEKNDQLVVKNNYQPRKTEDSIKSGLINLEQRYLNFVGKTIQYQLNELSFIVEIPIISNEK